MFEVVKLGVFESLLPNGSTQFGPMLYFIIPNKLSKLVDKKSFKRKATINSSRKDKPFLLSRSF